MYNNNLYIRLIDQDLTRDDLPCSILGHHFVNKAALQQHVLEITHEYELTQENTIIKLSEIHKEFIKEILFHHPKADEKLKSLQDIAYGYFPAKNKSKCFYIVKKV